MKPIWLLALAATVAVALACGSPAATPQLVASPAPTNTEALDTSTSTPASTGTAVPAPSSVPTPSVYRVGDTVTVGDVIVTLNSADASSGVLTANFTVSNNGAETVTVSSILSFDARMSDGTKLDYASCDTSSIGGSVVSGDKLKGNVCFKTAGDLPGTRIYFKPEAFGSAQVIFELQ